MVEDSRPQVEGSTRVWVGSAVMTLLGLLLGSALAIAGSLTRWRSDSVLGLYNRTGWRYENLIEGDGRITAALAVALAVFLLVGLLGQSRSAYMAATVAAGSLLALSIYELIYISTRPGITGPGSGIYMVLGGAVAAVLCSLGGYLMMAERHVHSAANSGNGNGQPLPSQ